MQLSDTRNGLIFILVSSMGYAGFPIFTKFIYKLSDMQPLDIAFWRFAFAVPLMWVGVMGWNRISKAPHLPKPLPRFALLLSGLLVAGAAITSFYGLQLMDAGLYVVIFFTYPAMVVVISALMGEAFPLRGWLALALTMIGVMLITPDIFNLTLQSNMAWGVIIALVNALMVAVFVVLNSRLLRGYPVTAISSAWSMTGTLLVVVPMAIVRGVFVPTTPTLWLLFLAMSLFSTVIAYFGLLMGTKLLGASRAAIAGTTEPAMAIILAWLLLGEKLLPIQLFGATLIIISVVVLEARFNWLRSPKVKIATKQS